MAKAPANTEAREDARSSVKCGLVMPISKTASHSAEHWADVQSLLHRAIKIAGFEPENVWEGDLTDRVSQRIVANIFANEIAVVDASDSNPNVMFELGLRLSSKRPTVVVADNLASLPFDIRDFRAIPYPPDLNILGMEKFFVELASALRAKYDAYQAGIYEPYLAGVVVEVVQPETKEVPYDSAVLDRLDEVLRRVSRIDSPSPKYANILAGLAYPDREDELIFGVPKSEKDRVVDHLKLSGIAYGIVEAAEQSYFRIKNLSAYPTNVYRDLLSIISTSGGSSKIPDGVIKLMKIAG